MKHLIWLLLLIPMGAWGQVSNPPIVLVSSAPSGSCTQNLPDQQVKTTGALYSCQSGTWTQIGGGGGSGTVSDGSGTTTPGQMAISTGTAHVQDYASSVLYDPAAQSGDGQLCLFLSLADCATLDVSGTIGGGVVSYDSANSVYNYLFVSDDSSDYGAPALGYVTMRGTVASPADSHVGDILGSSEYRASVGGEFTLFSNPYLEIDDLTYHKADEYSDAAQTFISPYWRDGSRVFNALDIEVSDFASDPTSSLIWMAVGGTPEFSVAKDGTTGIGSGSPITLNGTTGQASATTFASTGTQTVAGCSLSSASGGATAGQFASGTSGTCTVTITPGITATNGFSCWANDITTPADKLQQASVSTTAPTISGTTVSGDVVTWGCVAY